MHLKLKTYEISIAYDTHWNGLVLLKFYTEVTEHHSLTKNTFHITCPLWGESTSHQWIPLTKGQWCEAFVFFVVNLNKLLNKQLLPDCRSHDSYVTNTVIEWRRNDYFKEGACVILQTEDISDLEEKFIWLNHTHIWQASPQFIVLTHCDLVTPHGAIGLGQHWYR